MALSNFFDLIRSGYVIVMIILSDPYFDISCGSTNLKLNKSSFWLEVSLILQVNA
jgi:hypothetical protein